MNELYSSPARTETRSVTHEELRRVAGHFATGVTIVAAERDGRPFGLTVNSFASVSLAPPLIVVCLALAARSYAGVVAAPAFAVNILAADQELVARRFASTAEDKFTGLAYRRGRAPGAIIIDGVHAWLECRPVTQYPGGQTHTLIVAEVIASGIGTGDPLIFHRSRYLRPS